MRKTLLFATLGLVAFAASAQETGRVISSVPVIQQVAVPRQVCTQAQVVQQQPSSGGGALVGAIVGGILGNTIGHGMGRAAATGAGVIAGAAVGDSVENRTSPAVAAQQCTTQTFYENRTIGYNVTYEYAGKQYQVQMPYDPGPTIRLQVTPVGGGPVTPPPAGAPLVTAPPVTMAPVVETVAAVPAVIVPATVMYPAYYRPYPYYPVSLSLGFGYYRGWGGHHHPHGGHWR